MAKGEGVWTFEHSAAEPAKVLGKILAYKKIFSEKDCETPEHQYFYNLAKCPILYVMGELFDGDGHLQAKEVASIFRYDARKKAEGAEIPATMWFSVEGSILNKVPEDGIKMITDAVCRLVTITSKPCNKICRAELFIPQKESVQENPMDAFGKSEINYHSQILNIEPLPYIALTKSMKPILEYLPAEKYFDFTAEDHLDAADAHFAIASQAKGTEFIYHMAKSEEHMAKSTALERYLQSKGKSKHEQRAVRKQGEPKGVFPQSKHFPNKKGQSAVGDVVKRNVVHTQSDSFTPIPRAESVERAKGMHRQKLSEIKSMPTPDLGKALAAGGGAGAPSTLTGGAALSREHVRKKVEKVASKVKNLEKMGDYIAKKYKLNKHEGLALAKMLIFRKLKD